MKHTTIPNTRKIKVLIAEDKEVFRQGLKHIISAIPECQVIAETMDGPTTIVRALSLHPNLVLLREDLPLLDGIKTSKQIKKRLPDVKIIMLLAEASDFFKATESGADGYIMRETPEHLIDSAIQTIIAGGAWIGPLVANYILRDGLPVLQRASVDSIELPGLKFLTQRELDVLRLVVKGMSNRKIGESLGLEMETIKVHVRNILKKLELSGRAQVISAVLSAGRAI